MEQDIDNAFAELGLTRDATELEVKAAWRRLVSQWHPDRNDSSTAVAKIQRINRAFEAIRQVGFRATQRPSGADGSTPGRSEESQRDHKGADGDDPFHDVEEASASEFVDSGTASRKASEQHRRTINRKVKLTLEEAAFGCAKVLRGKVTDSCSTCEGTGYRVMGGHCPQCQGSGAVRQRTWFGWVGTQTECDACRGGGIARRTCGTCDGAGKSEARGYEVTVRFPHGVRDGDLLHVDGRRHKPGSIPGDLSIRVEVLEHDFLKLDKDGTVRCDVPVDGFAWIANRSIDVPTLSGLQMIQLHRDQLCYRLSGHGFPVERRGPRGDQLTAITPIFPQRLTTDQQILLDRLIATTSGPDAKQLDDRLRGWNQVLRKWKRGGQSRS